MGREAYAAPDVIELAPISFTAAAGSGEKNLWVPNIWTPVPALDPRGGMGFKICCGGILSTRSTLPGTLQWAARWGTSATPASNILLGQSTAINVTASLVNVPWYCEFTFNFFNQDIGAASDGIGNGFAVYGDLTITKASLAVMSATAPTNLDTTTAQGIIISTNFSQATTSTATCQWAFLRSLN